MSNSSDTPGPGGGEFKAAPTHAVPSAPSVGALSADELIVLNEEIASMARAGLPLDQSLALLAREIGRGKLRAVTQKLADDLRAGFTLPEALKRQEGSVPPYYAALLAAGIRSGRMGDVLATLTAHTRAVADFRSNLFSALLYPVIVAFLGIALIVFVGYVVMPTYVKIYDDFKMKLPLLTEILIFVSRNSIELLVVPTVVIALVLATERWWLRSTAGGRRLWARLVFSLPLFGTIIRSSHLASFSELLGILLSQKIPLPEALRLAGETCGDPLLNEGTRQIQAELSQGTPFSVALKKQRLMPELIVWMIGFGERQGTLAEALGHIAQMYRRQAETRVTLLRTVLPPILIVLIASTMGALFIFGLMGPFLNLMDGLSGGFR